jgi:hypothetical protein
VCATPSPNPSDLGVAHTCPSNLDAASALFAEHHCATRRSHLGSALDGDDHHDAGRAEISAEMNTASVEVPITDTKLAGHGLGVASVFTSVPSVEGARDGAPKKRMYRGKPGRVQLPREQPPPPDHAALIAIQAIGEGTRASDSTTYSTTRERPCRNPWLPHIKAPHR